MGNGNQVMLIKKATIQPDGCEELTLSYFVCQLTGLEGEVLYALRVDKRCPDNVIIEREETPPLTGSLAEIATLAETFAVGTVPPCVLLEMVDEWFESSFPSCKHAAREENVITGL